MHLLYVHGLGGSLRAQPEIEAVFLPAGFRVVRIPVPYHDNLLELFGRLATLTFADLCLWIHEGAERLIRAAQLFAPEKYAVVGDSLGGFISVVAAQRDSRISNCVLLACSGDICDAATRLHRLNRALALVVGRFAPLVRTSRLRPARRPAASLLSASLSSSTRLIRTACRACEICSSWATRETRLHRRPYAYASHKGSGTQRYGWSTMRDAIIRLEKTHLSAMRLPSSAISRSLPS